MPSRRRHRRKSAADAPAAPAARLIQSPSDSHALARELLSEDRERPVVVVTVPREHSESYIDAERVASEVTELADVVVVATQDAAWGLSRRLPERSQVYGGAGRVYPVGTAWTQAPHLAPLSFAYSEADTEQATRKLVSDTLAIVGQHRGDEPPAADHAVVTGTVAQLIAPSRALVTLDDGTVASVMAELTVAGVAIDGILTVGQRVRGRHDRDNRLLDLRGELVATEVAVAGLTRGDVVAVRVSRVADDEVEVLVHPDLPRTVPRGRVTSNPIDSMRSLFSEGEIVAARVAWIEDALPKLRLDDVDDDEPLVASPALLPWGPPWLTMPPAPGPKSNRWDMGDGTASDVATGGATAGGPGGGNDSGTPGREQPPSTAFGTGPDPAPGGGPASLPERTARGAARTLGLTVDALRARLRIENARLQASEQERDEAVRRAREIDLELQDAREELQSMRTRLRNQGQQLAKEREARTADRRAARTGRAAESIDAGPAFLDPALQWRHEVYLAWVDRIPASDKARRPLPSDWSVGPQFLDSLEELEGITRAKVLDVVVEVLTGLAKEVPGRDLHRLRVAESGSAPFVTRDDGATCWRTALQRETPGARRLHYWELPGGKIELSRVVAHDDTAP